MKIRNRNLMGNLSLWWELQRMPVLDWIQVEVTSRCNASCLYCPKTVYGRQWLERDLSPELFRALLPFFATTRLVHLQGWGEPLLHPDLFDLIGLAKKAGCRVSTATNGMLLDRENITRLVASGIDHVAFSLAGLGLKNDAIRRGTRFEAVLRAISEIAAVKKERHSDTPAVNVAYMLLRSQISSLPEIIPALEGREIDTIIVSTLDFVPAGDLECERITAGSEAEYREWKSTLDGLVESGKRTGLSVHYRLSRPGAKTRSCTENPEQSVFVSADGMVSPCAFSNIAASGITHISEGCEETCERISFGSLSEERLSSIWRNERCTAFRRDFRRTPHPRCRGCHKLDHGERDGRNPTGR